TIDERQHSVPPAAARRGDGRSWQPRGRRGGDLHDAGGGAGSALRTGTHRHAGDGRGRFGHLAAPHGQWDTRELYRVGQRVGRFAGGRLFADQPAPKEEVTRDGRRRCSSLAAGSPRSAADCTQAPRSGRVVTRTKGSAMGTVTYRSVDVDGISVFYREAG